MIPIEQVVELIDASAVNASSVRLDWMFHAPVDVKFVEVSNISH